MKAFIFLSLSFMSAHFLSAQDSLRSKKSISLSQGFNYIVNKDLYRSPYVYHGLNPFVDLMFERSSAKSIQRINSGFTFGNIRTSFSPLASINMLKIDYSYLRKVSSNKRYSFYLGPQLDVLSWKANYFPEMQVPQYAKVHSYMLGLSLGAAANLDYKINSRSSIKLFLYSPVCAYVNRPHFLDGSPPQNQFSVFNLWNPQIQLTYEYKVSEKISVSINYRYQYLEYSKPKAIRMLGNGLSLGIKLRF